jgi:hypothetical protein
MIHSWIYQLRMCLLILLILSQNCIYVEQPAQSLLYMHRRWQWSANKVTYVSWFKQYTRSELISSWCQTILNPRHVGITVPKLWATYFWMMHYGSGSEKRTMVFGNLVTSLGLNKGRLTKTQKKKMKKVKTTRTTYAKFTNIQIVRI